MYDKESWKAGLRKGQRIAEEAINMELIEVLGAIEKDMSQRNEQQDELIHAINQLTAEVQKANAIREVARSEKTAATSYASAEKAIKALQKAIGVEADGKFGRNTYQRLYNMGMTYGLL